MATTLNRKDERQVREFTHKAIKSAVHDALFSPLTLGEKHDIRVKPKFETACWSYLPPHRIFVGMGIVDRAKESLKNEQLQGYVKSHVRHEFAHAHFTERDMRKVRAALKEIEAPFQLFNLFEDGRIEDRYRREAEYVFDWLVYEDLEFSEKPEGHLFCLIQAEGDIERVRSFIQSVDIAASKKKGLESLLKRAADNKNPAQQAAMLASLAAMDMGPHLPDEQLREQSLELFERVVPYYQRVIDAEDTQQVYPILKDWLDEFGRPESAPSMGCAGEPDEKSDLEIGADLADDPDFREAFEADTEEVKSGKDGDKGVKGKAKPDENADPVARKGGVLQQCYEPPDQTRVNKLVEKLKRFFMAEARMVATANPQRRISARHFAAGRPFYRVKQLEGKARKKLLFVLECSGSMGCSGGFHMNEGKILLAALSKLGKQGYVEGHVLICAGAPARWELYELPLADSVLAKVKAFAGAEGLEPAIVDNLALAKDADYVFVYTDAQITDRPIDKAKLHRYGVFTWGLYAGDRGDFHEEMQKYFDKDIMRADAEALVDAMLTQKK